MMPASRKRGDIYSVVHCASPVTVARTLRPSMYLPLLYVKSSLAGDVVQSCASTVSRRISSALTLCAFIQLALRIAASV